MKGRRLDVPGELKDCWRWGTGGSELEWGGRGGQTGMHDSSFHYIDGQVCFTSSDPFLRRVYKIMDSISFTSATSYFLVIADSP